jgi:hypothetical protein
MMSKERHSNYYHVGFRWDLPVKSTHYGLPTHNRYDFGKVAVQFLGASSALGISSNRKGFDSPDISICDSVENNVLNYLLAPKEGEGANPFPPPKNLLQLKVFPSVASAATIIWREQAPSQIIL